MNRTGGFVNTLYSFNNNVFDNIINNYIHINKDNSIENFEQIYTKINNKIEEYNNQNTSESDKTLIITIITQIKEELEKIENKINELNSKKKITFKSYIDSLTKAIKPPINYKIISKIIDNIKIYLETIKDTYDNYKNINCYVDDTKNFESCKDFPFNTEYNETKSKKNRYFDDTKEYLDHTFGIISYKTKFNDKHYNIYSYIILRKFKDDDKLYVLDSKDIKYLDNLILPETKVYILQENMSLKELTAEEQKKININELQYNSITHDGKPVFYVNFSNTKNCNFIKGKQLGNAFIKSINTIIKNYKSYNQDKLETKIIKQEFKNLIIDIQKLLKLLYRYDHKEKKYVMYDEINFRGNIVLYLLFINKISVIFNLLKTRKFTYSRIRYKDDKMLYEKKIYINKEEIKKEIEKNISMDEIKYSFNMYIYLKYVTRNFKDLTPKKEEKHIKTVNKFLKNKNIQIYKLFLDEITDFIEILININSKFNDLANAILCNFILRVIDLQNDYFPLSKNKILVTLLESKPILEKNRSNIDIEINNNEIYSGNFILLKKSVNAQFEGISYPDCGELTLFNIFNYLLTHSNKIYSNNFKIEKLPENSEIKKFYEKLNTFENLYNKYIREKRNNINFGSEFYKLFSNKKDVEYYRQKCDIIPDINNILKICNILMVRTDENKFKTFEEFITHFDERNNIDNNTINYTINGTLKITFGRGHAFIQYMNSSTDDILTNVFIDDYEHLNRNLYLQQSDLTEYQDLNDIYNINKLLIYSDNIYTYLDIFKENLTNMINLLISQNILKFNIKDEYRNNTLLHLAIINDLEDIAEKIINKLQSTDLNIQNNEEDTPLHLAIINEKIEIAEKLIDKLEPNELTILNNEKYTPLHLAIVEQMESLANKILNIFIEKNNLPIIMYDTPFYDSLLHTSIKYNLVNISNKILDYLLEYKDTLPFINIIYSQDYDGNTPLHLALYYNMLDVADKILNNIIESYTIKKRIFNINTGLIEEKIFDIEIKNNNDETPLNIAMNNNFTTIITKINKIKSLI